MTPGEAILGFLDAFGVPAARVPAGLPAQAGLLRSVLAGRQVLVLLDNARDARQVRPLLPGAPGCLVLVTSRSHLPSLVAGEEAHPVNLDVLTSAEAADLAGRAHQRGRRPGLVSGGVPGAAGRRRLRQRPSVARACLADPLDDVGFPELARIVARMGGPEH